MEKTPNRPAGKKRKCEEGNGQNRKERREMCVIQLGVDRGIDWRSQTRGFLKTQGQVASCNANWGHVRKLMKRRFHW